MAAQSDLVAILGQFDPKLIKMAPQRRTSGGLMEISLTVAAHVHTHWPPAA
jgi:hypothetical protein